MEKFVATLEEISKLKKEMRSSRRKHKMVTMTLERQGRKLNYSRFKYKKEIRSSPSLRRNFIKTRKGIMKKSYL